jgi:hypothetical protein
MMGELVRLLCRQNTLAHTTWAMGWGVWELLVHSCCSCYRLLLPVLFPVPVTDTLGSGGAKMIGCVMCDVLETT